MENRSEGTKSVAPLLWAGRRVGGGQTPLNGGAEPLNRYTKGKGGPKVRLAQSTGGSQELEEGFYPKLLEEKSQEDRRDRVFSGDANFGNT